MELSEIIRQAMEQAEARDQAEAAELGITVDELHERRAHAAKRTSESELHDWVRDHEDFAPVDDLWSIIDGKLGDWDALRHVKAWLRTDWPFLVLQGDVGSGKTIAALHAAWSVRPSRVVVAPDLPKAIEPWDGDRANGWKPMPLHLPMVVLDDLGTENATSRFHEAFFKLVNGRQSRRVKTVITTNLGPEDLLAKYGPRVGRRLKARGKFVKIARRGT